MPLPPTALAGLRPVPDIDEPEAPETPEQSEGTLKPEWVNYRTEAENCKNCQFMQGSQCSVLNIQVGPEDHCSHFENKQEQPAPDESQGDQPEEDTEYPQ